METMIEINMPQYSYVLQEGDPWLQEMWWI